MAIPNRFNIRVYGIWLLDNQVLVSEEQIKGQAIIKFPGGGLDFGEGTIDCLKREWKEELDLDIEVLEHFYTTDFYQASAFDNSQVISIYYRIAALKPELVSNNVAGERSYWLPWSAVTAATFTLPIDQKIGAMLHQLYLSK